jgi:TatA/E family protein of Tat protein translocase
MGQNHPGISRSAYRDFHAYPPDSADLSGRFRQAILEAEHAGEDQRDGSRGALPDNQIGRSAAASARPRRLRMLGPQDLWIGLALGVFFFGAKKLPELSRSLGQAMSEFKKGVTNGAQDEAAPPAPSAKP